VFLFSSLAGSIFVTSSTAQMVIRQAIGRLRCFDCQMQSAKPQGPSMLEVIDLKGSEWCYASL